MFYNKQSRDIGQVNASRLTLVGNEGGTVQLDSMDQVVVVKALASNITMKLPPISEVIGKGYTIDVVTYTSGAITLSKHDNDDVSVLSNLTLDVASDRVTLLSNGYKWIIVENRIAP